MQKKKVLISINMSLLFVLLASFLCVLTFRTINKVFFSAAADQAVESMEVIRDLGIQVVEDNLVDLKRDLKAEAEKYSDLIINGVPSADALASLKLPKDGIDYCAADSDGSWIDSDGNSSQWEKELDLQSVFDSGKTIIADPYFNGEDQYILNIAVPLKKDGQVTSALVLRMDGFCISRWLESIQFTTGEGVAYIIAGDGRNIAASREKNYDWITSLYNSQEIADTNKESKTVADLEKQPLQGKTGHGSYLWEGSRNYLVYAPMHETDWGFFVGFYGDLVKSYISSSAQRSMMSSIPFFLAVLLFFALLAAYANYNLKKEKGYVKELIRQKKEIEKQSEALSINEERFRVALAQTSNTIFEYDPDTGSITNFYASKMITHNLNPREGLEQYIITDGTIDEESVKTLRNIFNDTQQGIFVNECIIKVNRNDNTAAWYKISISPLTEQRTRVIGIVENITKEKMADFDPLTGLLNKKVITEQVTDYLKNRKHSELSAFLMIDIDDFKNVNDMYGHPAGDYVIIRTGQILQSIFSQNSYLGRVGGDEFCIFCFALSSPAVIEDDMALLYSHAGQEGEEIQVTYSVGIVLFSGEDITTFEEIYEKADSALYTAKKIKGKNNYCFYKEDKR